MVGIAGEGSRWSHYITGNRDGGFFSLGAQPAGCCCAHSGRVFTLTPCRNSFTDMPRGVSPR